MSTKFHSLPQNSTRHFTSQRSQSGILTCLVLFFIFSTYVREIRSWGRYNTVRNENIAWVSVCVFSDLYMGGGNGCCNSLFITLVVEERNYLCSSKITINIKAMNN